jgi:hypothetical protein
MEVEMLYKWTEMTIDGVKYKMQVEFDDDMDVNDILHLIIDGEKLTDDNDYCLSVEACKRYEAVMGMLIEKAQERKEQILHGGIV